MEEADIFFLQEYSETHTVAVNFEYYTCYILAIEFLDSKKVANLELQEVISSQNLQQDKSQGKIPSRLYPRINSPRPLMYLTVREKPFSLSFRILQFYKNIVFPDFLVYAQQIYVKFRHNNIPSKLQQQLLI